MKETDAGIVIRGAHSIATSVTMADWLFVSYITPLTAGDVDYAISLVVPVNAEGLRLLPRRPYSSIRELRWNETATVTTPHGDLFVRAIEVKHWGARVGRDKIFTL